MASNDHPHLLLIMDDDGDESHAVHILAKYHFTNSVIKVRKAADALRHFAQTSPSALPEMIILSVEDPAQVSLAIASRKGALAEVPLIVVAGGREVEETIRQFALPHTYCMGKPLGFFKLLEGMQKLGMFWVVLRSHPGDRGDAGAAGR